MDNLREEVINIYADPIKELLQRTDISEICINSFDNILFEVNGRFHKHKGAWKNDDALCQYIDLIAKSLKQRVDNNNPILDARLKDGTRVNAVKPPVAVGGANITMRLYPSIVADENQLIEWGGVSIGLLALLKNYIRSKKNVIIAGGTGSGKTTILRLMAGWIPHDERVVVVEDTTEHLIRDHPNYVSMEAAKREDAHQNKTEVTLGRLIENCLRQRPDRIIVGEIRDSGAARAFLQAINTGHDGVLGTIHANSAEDVIDRLVDLTLREGVDVEYLRKKIARDIDAIIWIGKKKEKEGTFKRVREIAEIPKGGALNMRVHYNEEQQSWIGA
jgi:pilus assembly protein CpaF